MSHASDAPWILTIFCAALAACGGKVIVDGDGDAAGAGGAASSSDVSASSSSSSSGLGGAGGSPADAGPDGPLPPPPVAVYANSGNTLYLLDPVTKAVTTIGQFKG